MSVNQIFSGSRINYIISVDCVPLLEEEVENIQEQSFVPIYQAQTMKEIFPLNREVIVVYPCLLIPLHTDKYNQAKIKGIFQSVIEKYNIPLKHASNYREGTDAFGKYIRKLLFSENSFSDPIDQAAQKALVENMKVVAQQQGFKFTSCKAPFPRDSFILARNGTHVLCAHEKQDLISNAIDLHLSKTFISREGARNQTRHPFFKGWLGQSRNHFKHAEKDFKEHFSIKERFLSSYLEGGNQYIVDNPGGETQLLMGQDSFFVYFNYLVFSDYFSEQSVADLLNQKSEEIKLALTPDKIQRTLLEMHSAGRIKQGKGIISREEIREIQKDPRSKDHALTMAKDRGYYRPLDLSNEQITDLGSKIIEYVFQKRIALYLIAKGFGVELKNIHLISQSSYHIDLHMRPGPKGSFFIQSYAFCCDILQTIDTFAIELELTQKDISILQNYLECMKTLKEDLEPLMEQISEEIRKAGFTTIPAPATFYNNVFDNSVNFMNAITGCSEKTGEYYYIVLGAQLGDRLGKILMQVYAQFLSTYQRGIHVHYVGYDPQQPEDFFSAEIFSKDENDCGVHCMSAEYETASNISNVIQKPDLG